MPGIAIGPSHGKMRPSPLPTCAACGRPVERVERRDRVPAGEVVLTAYCHGEREEIVVPLDLFEGAYAVGPGFAFTRPRALGAKTP